MPMLLIFSGLPGTGKTTLSQQLAQKLHAVHLRIDTIEQVLRDLYDDEIDDKGYRLAYRIAADNLGLGMDVIADSCNPIDSTRRSWEQVAKDADSAFINIEIVCSDPEEHRRRVEARISDVSGLQLPTWNEVINRTYDKWKQERIIVDTAGRSETDSLEALLRKLDLGRYEK